MKKFDIPTALEPDKKHIESVKHDTAEHIKHMYETYGIAHAFASGELLYTDMEGCHA